MGETGIVNLTANPKTHRLCWKFGLHVMHPLGATVRDRRGMIVARLGHMYRAKGCAMVPKTSLDLLEPKPGRRLLERAEFWVERPWLDLPDADPRHHYRQVRQRSLRLLTQRTTPLERRLAALGIALAAFDATPAASPDDVDRIFDRAEHRLRPEEAASPRRPPDNLPVILLDRLRTWVAMPGLPARPRACLDWVRRGLALPDDPSAPLDVRVHEAYRAGLRLVGAYLARRPYAFEHVVLNYVLVGTFPFHPTRRCFEECALLASRYVLLQLQCAGAARALGSLTDEAVVQIVQSFDKYVDSEDFWHRTLGRLDRAGALSPTGLTTILGVAP
jgi:hypothetical protein